MNNSILEKDIKEFCTPFLSKKNKLFNNQICVTGATGLIGSILVKCLLALNENITIVVPVRNKKKACGILGKDVNRLNIIECDVIHFDYAQIGKVDYIIHCAAPTASKFFVEHPVETFDTIIQGTQSVLEYARKHPVKGIVYLSSLEVYGEVLNDSKAISEDYQGYLNPLDIRSSYPMAKRAAENLCCLYCKEYQVPVKIARLTQTTGPGIAYDDNRIIAQFARLTAEGKDIILHTKGESARPYCYTLDAVSAILKILLNGESGEAYNVANEATYISAYDMALFLQKNFNPSINVRIERKDNMGYAPITKLRLSTKKLEALGWKPKYGLKEIFTNLIAYLKESPQDVH